MNSTEENKVEQKISGVGGWLGLFLFSIFFQLLYLFQEYTEVSELGNFWNFPLSYIYILLSAIFVIYTAGSLIKKKNNAVSLATMYLIFILFASFWGGIIVIADDTSTNSTLLLQSFFGAFVYFAIWQAYLVKSKRLANTYPYDNRKIKKIDVIFLVILLILPVLIRYNSIKNYQNSNLNKDIINSQTTKLNYEKNDIKERQDISFINYKIRDVGFISIPSNIEIQSGQYKEINDAYLKEIMDQFDYELLDDRVIFQQKGLNTSKKDSFETYVRVIIETDKGTIGDYDTLKTELNASPTELAELGKIIKPELENILSKTGINMLEWYEPLTVTVNGVDALKISYSRQLNNNPPVLVEIYEFYNNDRMHRLTLSYRVEESKIWKSLLEDVLRSFTITNII